MQQSKRELFLGQLFSLGLYFWTNATGITGLRLGSRDWDWDHGTGLGSRDWDWDHGTGLGSRDWTGITGLGLSIMGIKLMPGMVPWCLGHLMPWCLWIRI